MRNNIILINPPHLEVKLNYSSIYLPPLGLCYIASYLRKKGYNVQIIDAVSQGIGKRTSCYINSNITVEGLCIDEIVEKIPLTSDVIGVSCMFTPYWPYVRELVKAIKKRFPKIPLIMGGEHVAALWELILLTSPVDFCILGEGEVTCEELIKAIYSESDLSQVEGIAYMDRNKPVSNKPRLRIRDLDSIPLPAWDLIDIEKYIERKLFEGPCKGRTMPILATRGCPFRCRFCTAENMWGGAWIPRKAEKVVDEVQLYIDRYNANDFHLMDLTAIVRRDWVITFAKEILRRGLKISWQLPVGTRDIDIDREITGLLMKSGCTNITFAPESASEDVLDKMGKKINMRHLENSVRAALDSGMITGLYFLIGFPGEEMQDIKKTFKLIRKMALMGLHEVAISTFIPIPGSAIFNELKLKDSNRFKLTDEFCYTLFSSVSLYKTISWNSSINNKQLLHLKIRGLVMFYGISFIIRPWRLIKILVNLFTGKQETKIERVLIEMFYKYSWRH